MSNDRQITVAIPTCNGARFLPQALRSVLSQEVACIDLVVCDDRSEDDTLAIVRQIVGERARVEVNSERLGLAGNWNRCVALSRTPWVAVFHQDDVMHPGHIEAHLRAIGRRPGLGMVCSGGDVIDAEGREVPPDVVEWPALRDHDTVFEPGEFVRELAYSNPVRCSAVTLRRSAHQELGGFDPAWRYAVDWEFWVRLARRFPVAWLCRRTVAVRWHPESETHAFRTGTLDLDEQARLIDEIHARDSAGWPDARLIRRLADRRLARAYLNRAYSAAKASDHALARRCLRRSLGLWPGIAGRIASDPRLLLRVVRSCLARTAPRA